MKKKFVLLLCLVLFCLRGEHISADEEDFQKEYKLFLTGGVSLYYGNFGEEFYPTVSPFFDFKFLMSERFKFTLNYTGISNWYEFSESLKHTNVSKTSTSFGIRLSKSEPWQEEERRSEKEKGKKLADEMYHTVYFTVGTVNFYSGTPIVKNDSQWVESVNWKLNKNANMSGPEIGIELNMLTFDFRLSAFYVDGSYGITFEPLFCFDTLFYRPKEEFIAIGSNIPCAFAFLGLSATYWHERGFYIGVNLVNIRYCKVNFR